MTVVMALVGVLAVAAVGWGVFGLLGDGGDSTSAQEPSTPTSAEPAGAAATSHSGHGSASTGTPSGGSATAAPATTAPTVQQCRDEAASGRKVVDALEPLAQQWKTHTSTQRDVNGRHISVIVAKERWAVSKAAGPKSQQTYRSALKTYTGLKGSCSKLKEDQRAKVASCVTSAAEAGKATAAGAPIADDWQKHLAAMKTKGHTDMTHYWDVWRAQVDKAPGQVSRFTSAQKAYEKAPACSA